MNILELIKDCEVKWNTLGEVAKIKHGKDWKVLDAGDIPVYGSGGIMGYVNQFSYDKPTVLIPRKGSITNLFYLETPFWNVDTIYYTEIDNSQILEKFLFYFLKTVDLEKLDTGSGRPSLTQAILNQIKIPIPPLEIQEKIVKTLDIFTELEATLEAELSLRVKQYDYYRNELLTFGDEIEWKSLGEVAEIGTGSRNTNEAIDNGLYPFFVRSQEPKTINEYEFDETSIITAGDGVGVGKVFHYVSGKYALHQRAYRIVVNSERIIPKFLFYFIQNNFAHYLRMKSANSSVTSLRKPMFEKYQIPIPLLSTQQKIVDILDKFDRLTNSISDGLPKEIELRRKQYEYYREQLLAFPKAA